MALTQKSPDFTEPKPYLSLVTPADYAGNKLIIASVPSLDTSVCSLETKRFNDEA
ncbi:redoxin family protein [Oceanidesulfovibrio marinus]|uniref:redoxin family protein n=1 Tax=Oceanidesulfovibrio marinus TaxID=370038 RepID=UPI00142EA06B|nr:redoxin family protein [Oceanidesulfovibrio marinus]